jgi:hypothetical protein
VPVVNLIFCLLRLLNKHQFDRVSYTVVINIYFIITFCCEMSFL